MARTLQQSEKNVRNLSGLQAIREKPTRFIGEANSSGMWTCLREVLDNTVDEHGAGRNDVCRMIADPENKLAYYILDAGGGMPTGTITVENPIDHSQVRVSALKALTGLTSTGSKFDAAAYDTARGTHGEGIKATNAMSAEFTVWTFRDKQWWTISYAKGVEIDSVRKTTAPALPDGTKPKKGTVVYVRLDQTVFDRGSKVEDEDIFKWFNITSAFADGLKLSYRNAKGEEYEWLAHGPEAYLDSQLESLKANKIDNAVCSMSGSWFDFVLTFTDYDGIQVEGFVNGLHNPSGGTHVNTVYEAVYHALSAHIKRGHSFKPSDIRDGLVGAINVKLSAAKFSNQIKETLKDERAGAPLYADLFPALEKFFDSNKKLAQTLCERATQMAALKRDFQQNKRVMKVLTTARKRGSLPNKLASAPTCLSEDRELYLVEGDSAGGSCKLARDSSYQEILPLKGKIPNPFGGKSAVVIENEEVLMLLQAIGYDPALDDPFSNLRVGRVILLTDSDVDGCHIQNLILAVIARFVPQLLDDGRVFAAYRYEYMVKHNGSVWFAETRDQLMKMAPKAAHGNILHLKGLGEVDPDVLAQMAMNPESRKLIQLSPVDKKGLKALSDLMGQDTSVRKQLLGI